MVTGSGEVLDFQPLIAQITVRIKRNEYNSTSSDHYTKLLGSKIRARCILYHVTRDEKWLKSIVGHSYYNLLSPEDVLRLIVGPINKSIFEAQAPPKSASVTGPARTKRKASSLPKSSASTNKLARESSPPKSRASASVSVKSRKASSPKSRTSATGPTGQQRTTRHKLAGSVVDGHKKK